MWKNRPWLGFVRRKALQSVRLIRALTLLNIASSKCIFTGGELQNKRPGTGEKWKTMFFSIWNLLGTLQLNTPWKGYTRKNHISPQLHGDDLGLSLIIRMRKRQQQSNLPPARFMFALRTVAKEVVMSLHPQLWSNPCYEPKNEWLRQINSTQKSSTAHWNSNLEIRALCRRSLWLYWKLTRKVDCDSLPG